MKSTKRIHTIKDRKQLAELYNQEMSIAAIARTMEVSLWQVRYELERGYTGETDEYGRPIYDPAKAQRAYNSKQFRAGFYGGEEHQ